MGFPVIATVCCVIRMIAKLMLCASY